jgi:hypothetical protein
VTQSQEAVLTTPASRPFTTSTTRAQHVTESSTLLLLRNPDAQSSVWATRVIAGKQQSKAFREAVRSIAVQILENPLKTFDHVISGQKFKGFYGIIDGKQVAFFVAKEARGKIGIGELVTAVVPTPQQMINWGLR